MRRFLCHIARSHEESLRCVTEILGSLPSQFDIDEEILRFDGSLKEKEFPLLVFRRKET